MIQAYQNIKYILKNLIFYFFKTNVKQYFKHNNRGINNSLTPRCFYKTNSLTHTEKIGA
jgi:hypothetical protein